MEYWRRLDDVIQHEPREPRDTFFHAMLRPLGLERGEPFRPDARQTKILTDAALVGEAMAKANTADRRFAGVRFRPDTHWDLALQLDADAPAAFWDLLDERASWFYEAFGAGANMAPKRPGPSSAYLSSYRDSAGHWLDGGTSYRLRVPPKPPVKLFWSVTVYDVGTRALILNDQKIADRANPERIRRNEPLLVPTRRNTTPTDLPSDRYIGATFTYQIKVENTGAQTVQEVVWEYAFLDPASGKVLRSMTFQTEAKIKPGERDTLKETSRTLPPFLAAAPAGERITVKSVRYSDGTVWKADPK
jgi:hypothetical protein